MELSLKAFVLSKKAPRCSTHFKGINNYKNNSHKNYQSHKSVSNKAAHFFDDAKAFKDDSIEKGDLIS